MYNQCKN